MKIESGTTNRSNQKYASTWLGAFILSVNPLDEGSRGKVKDNYFLGCMVDLPNGGHETYCGLNSREEATLNSQFIRETHGSHLAYMSYLENELKMVRIE